MTIYRKASDDICTASFILPKHHSVIAIKQNVATDKKVVLVYWLNNCYFVFFFRIDRNLPTIILDSVQFQRLDQPPTTTHSKNYVYKKKT